ncbi:MAG: hypothetical protein K2O01_01835 [Bacteroidales bacterium]|nr:hypothetical protein [Bacteroidales bacterium]
MKTLRLICKTSAGLSVWFVFLALAACRPDEDKRSYRQVPEGEEAVVSLKWTMPAMEENQFQLCSPVSEERSRRIEDIWVGIYNVKTGACTAKLFVGLQSDSPEHVAQKLKDIKTKSGESYIVAAANVWNSYGVSEQLSTTGDTVCLAKLLQKADTWEKYKSISAVLPQPGQVRPDGLFVMAGSFHKGTADDTPAGGWSDENGNPETVTIGTGMTEDLGGYIHLRRLFAYNRFTVTAGKYVKMELLDWQVCNLPVMSYLQERKSENSADVSVYFSNGKREDYKGNHGTMPVSHIFEKGDGEGEYVFDFYQFENRHAGLKKQGDIGVAEYADRDREWKDGTGGNTGIYKSLCRDDRVPEPGPVGKGVNTNNYATYIILRAEVAYYVSELDIDAAPVAHPDDTPPEGAVLRTGYATYAIHLGYCEGKAFGADSLARDFNVRRNNWYEYKVRINGLKHIGLEATSGTVENQPGAEGDVFDSENVVELDAHYGVFNIKMTNAQRNNLRWVVSAPYGNAVHHLAYADYPTGETDELRKNRFYNWIRFKPAPSEDLLAVYKENPGESDENLWTLDDLRDVKGHPGIDKDGQAEVNPDPAEAKTERWYTVFVNEYVYEDGPDESMSGNWRSYVNRPARVAYLNTNARISADKQSTYMTPQYTVIQRSIQTYYDLYAPMTTALGVERENEGYGLNMRWSDVYPLADGKESAWNPDNGRWNEWDYLTGGAMGASGKQWHGEILPEVTKVGGRSYLPAARTPTVSRQYESKPATTHPVYALRPIEGNYFNFFKPNALTDPADADAFYEYMAACLNRNRDENGNGRIDREELKWYLATSGKYFRIVLGRRSLDKPLMEFGVQLAANNAAGYATRHHYASSDQKIIWAEEGIASSDLAVSNERMPWQVRCVRNLGVNFSNVLREDPVLPAYRGDAASRMVYLDYYDGKSLRAERTGSIPVHKVNEDWNMTARRFEYAGEDCKNIVVGGGRLGVDENGVVAYYGGIESVPVRYRDATESDLAKLWEASVAANEFCKEYTQWGYGGTDKGTWRVPNQKELTIMLRLGIFERTGCKWLSCSKEYYENEKVNPRYFGVFVNKDGGGQATMGQAGSHRIRCVRDVE